jgi:hypothetical protein
MTTPTSPLADRSAHPGPVAIPPEPRRPPLDRGAIVFDLVLVAFTGLIVVTAFGIGPRARLVPLVIGIPTLLGLVAQVVVDLRLVRWPRSVAAATVPSLDHAHSDIEAAEAAVEEVPAEPYVDPDEALRSRQLLAGWAIAYVIGVFLTDFLIATPIALLAILVVGTRKVLLSAVVTLAACVFLYVVFVQLLHVPM